MSIWETLETNDRLTGTECDIAKWLRRNPDRVGEMKLSTATKEMAVSSSAMIRFCQKLGFHGYKDFQLAFVTENEQRRNLTLRDIDFNYPFAENESVADIIKRNADLMKETVDICYSSLSREKLTRAADWIFHSRHLYLFGAGDSYISALSFSNRLTKLGIAPVMPMQFFEMASITKTASKEDIALIVTYSGSLLPALENEIQLLKQRKCRIILISSLTAAKDADLLISIPQKEDYKNKISVYYSQTALEYVFFCLFGIIYSMDYEGHTQRLAIG